MSTASWALQVAIHEALTADPDVTALLGGEKLYDHVPQGTTHPYVTFGISTETDWSTGTEIGHVHNVILNVWSMAPGRYEVQQIIAAIRLVLHDQSLALDGFQLINLRHVSSKISRMKDGERWRGQVQLRAVTEANA
ncbi:MAG: DUF3168 domain-containing protein [Pseudomonadota bacterium]